MITEEKYVTKIICPQYQYILDQSIIIGYLSSKITTFLVNTIFPCLREMYLKINYIEDSIPGLLAGIARDQQIKCPACSQYDKWTTIKIIETDQKKSIPTQKTKR